MLSNRHRSLCASGSKAVQWKKPPEEGGGSKRGGGFAERGRNSLPRRFRRKGLFVLLSQAIELKSPDNVSIHLSTGPSTVSPFSPPPPAGLCVSPVLLAILRPPPTLVRTRGRSRWTGSCLSWRNILPDGDEMWPAILGIVVHALTIPRPGVVPADLGFTLRAGGHGRSPAVWDAARRTRSCDLADEPKQFYNPRAILGVKSVTQGREGIPNRISISNNPMRGHYARKPAQSGLDAACKRVVVTNRSWGERYIHDAHRGRPDGKDNFQNEFPWPRIHVPSSPVKATWIIS